MIELGTVVRELIKGKKAESNLPVYTKGLMDLYKRVAYLRLAFNYYTFSEVYYEFGKDRKDVCAYLVKDLQGLINDVIIDNNNDSDVENKIINLRNEIINKMDAVTTYADKLGLYEYILNRVEYRFNECEFDNNYYKNNFETDIYNYVIGDKDNSVINMRLAMVMSELPMRLTKNKFFDILRDSFSIYKGSEKLAVNDFVYRIKTAGGIYCAEGMEEKFPKLKLALEEFKIPDYQKMSEEEFKIYREKLDNVTAYTLDYSDIFISLAEVVNDLYTIILCESGDYSDDEMSKLRDIIGYCYGVINGDNDPDIIWAEKFVEFEGLQEKLRYMLDAPENALTEIYNINADAVKELKLSDAFDKLTKSMSLQSSSNFVTFDESEELKEEADDAYINNVVDDLVEEFSKTFEDCGRIYMRAVMAGVISNLPAYFNNLGEFKDYVNVSLNQCSDEAEQKACMTLINMMIASE